jgi:hypothetical protein
LFACASSDLLQSGLKKFRDGSRRETTQRAVISKPGTPQDGAHLVASGEAVASSQRCVRCFVKLPRDDLRATGMVAIIVPDVAEKKKTRDVKKFPNFSR